MVALFPADAITQFNRNPLILAGLRIETNDRLFILPPFSGIGIAFAALTVLYEAMTTPQISFPSAIVRSAGLLAVMTIAVLSLVPGDLRPSVPVGFQHFVAYFFSAVFLSFGYRNWNPVVIASLMSLYALVLEIAQNLVPGRTPALADFTEGVVGTIVGVIVARFILSVRAYFSA